MVEREPVGDAAAAIVAREREAHMAERRHELHHHGRHGALGVGRVVASRLRNGRPAVAGEVGDHQGEMPGQLGRHLVPHHIGLGVAVQQQERRPAAAGAREDLAGRGVDPVRGETGIEVGEVGHENSQRNTGLSRRGSASGQPPVDAFSRATACQPMSRRQKPSGQRILSIAA